MAESQPDLNDEDPPLDPAVERVRRKLARLMVGSIGIMILGLIAVFAAIVYKLVTGPEATSGTQRESAGLAARIERPVGSSIVGVDIEGDRIVLHLRDADGNDRLAVHDAGSGALLGVVDIVSAGD